MIVSIRMVLATVGFSLIKTRTEGGPTCFSEDDEEATAVMDELFPE